MDGASKFVRGDAIAGIIIVLINIVGGLIIGVFQHGLDIATAAQTYTLLTVGDGLVAQIPALVISTAAGILVTRVVRPSSDLNQQLLDQLGGRPQVFYIVASHHRLPRSDPGHAALRLSAHRGGAGRPGLLDGAACARAGAGAKRRARDQAAGAAGGVVVRRGAHRRARPGGGLPAHPAGGPRPGRRAAAAHPRAAQEVRLRDGLPGARRAHPRQPASCAPTAYRITLKGVEAGSGEVFPGMYMAINPGRVLGPLQGQTTRDPAFGLPAVFSSVSVPGVTRRDDVALDQPLGQLGVLDLLADGDPHARP